MSRQRVVAVAAIVGAAAWMSAACAGPAQSAPASDATSPAATAVAFDTEYQAVLLANGQLFFGKLEGYGTRRPLLRNVYYVRTVPGDTPGAQNTNALVKRGQEWHAPTEMYLNPDQIVLIEPVSAGSKVADLIRKGSTP